MLLHSPSGDLFGLTQNAGMGWNPAELGRKQFLILSTQGGLRAPDGQPIALGYHTGHWEIGLLVQAAAEEFRQLQSIPFAGFCSDPCDGRTQGTTGMFDSLPYRNDAAILFRRLARSLPRRSGVLGIATCDKGLPAMMMAVAGLPDLPCVIVPGGVTLPPTTAKTQAQCKHSAPVSRTAWSRCRRRRIWAAAHVVRQAAAASFWAPPQPRKWSVKRWACRCRTRRWRRQVNRFGWTLPDARPRPCTIWMSTTVYPEILTRASIENAMVVHAAFGGSTNLLLHIPAIAHAAGLERPIVDDWISVNRRVPRLVSVLPNGPIHHPTVRVFLAGGVPEVMLHLRRLGLLNTEVLTVTGQTLGENLEWWENSDRRARFRELLRQLDGVEAGEVIFQPEAARNRGMTGTLVFPRGNLAPEGSVVKAAAIDPGLFDANGVYRHEGPARVFVNEKDAMAAIKKGLIQAGDVLVLTGVGPMGTGMEETYQVTGALKYLPHGKQVALLTDARFSGVSTGACIGHIGPEGLAGGPIGKILEDDVVRIVIDRNEIRGSIDLVGEGGRRFSPEEGAQILARRSRRNDLTPNPALPDDTRLWAALQMASGGTWAGCVYDPDRIVELLRQGAAALNKHRARPHDSVP